MGGRAKDGRWKRECWGIERWKKDGATGPSSQQFILAFAISGDAGLSTILHQAIVRLALTHDCSRLVGAVADPPRVTEGVVDREEILDDFDEHWKVL